MNVRASLLTSALLAALATTSLAAPAWGADDARKKEAQTLFDMASKQAESGDTAAALSSFRASYDKFPSYRVLYNIGKMCGRMGDAPCAVRSYEQYLRDGGAEVPAKRKKELEAEIKALSRTLARLTVTSNVTGAEVSIDDVVVGKTPLAAPVPIGGGSHKIALVHEGAKVEKTITAVAGESASVSLDTKDAKKDEPAPAAPAASETKEPEEPAAPERKREPEEPKAFPVVPWAVTGALAAATVVTGILASSAYGDYKDKRESYPITRDELDGAQSTARDLFVLSSVLGVGTVIAAGVSTYFTFFTTSSTQGPPPSKARIGLAVGPTGISIQGVTP